jgi:cytochrome c-type biogenesis protein CcmE
MTVMTTGRKLAIAGLVVASVTAYMGYLGAAASWQYYVTAEECLANATSLAGHRIRVSGKIVSGSLHAAADRSEARFLLAGHDGNLPVVCSGPLPDNLAGSAEVVVEGRLEGARLFRGDKLITRCASKYTSSQSATVSSSLRPASTEATR